MSSLKSRILLVNPPYPSLWKPEGVDPLGLGYIASYLISKGFENVEIYDMVNRTEKEFKKKIMDFEPDFTGISVPFTKSLPTVKNLAHVLKATDALAKTVIGGIHPSVDPTSFCDTPEVSYIIMGDGELAFHDILTIPVDTIFSHPIEDLDSLPFPLRTFSNPNRVGVVTSRGCPFDCSFCSVQALWGKKWRARSPENVIAEIKTLPVSHITFEDDNLTLDRDRAEKLFTLMTEQCKVKWSTPNGVYINSLDKDLLELMKKSGCFALNLAIESGNDYIRNEVIGKKLTKDKIREVVRACKELEILTLGYFVIGMPGETLDSMQESLEFAKELLLDVINVFIATPYPGSRLFNYCNENQLFLTDDFEKFGAFDAVFETPQLSAKDVKEFRMYFQTEFNKYHDLHSDITTERKRNMIRRPLC